MSSAADTVNPVTESKGPAPKPSARANPVALEALVGVTGRRADKPDARELFNEETHTVLVFPDGAVIRLNAGVAPGQLVFLSNKKNGGEVVCQVVNTRECTATTRYVELTFTENKENFWGVAFPSGGNAGAEFSAKEQVEAQATTQSGTGKPVEPHKEEEADQLRKEVEALRKQLLELAAKKPVPMKDAGGSAGQATAGAGQAVSGPKADEAKESPLMPAATEAEKTTPTRPVVAMSLPTFTKGTGTTTERDASEDLLPQPELDFSKMPGAVQGQRVKSPLRGTRKVEFHKVKAPALGVLVVVLAVCVWFAKPWSYFGIHRGQVPAAGTVRPQSTPVAPLGKAEPAARTAATKAEKAMARKNGTTGAPVGEKNASAAVPETNTSGGPASEAAVEKTAPNFKGEEPVTKGRAARRNESVPERKAGGGAASEAGVNDAEVLPAKLMRAANPVYPPDAMLRFITGDVKAEIVVGTDGRVGEVKVLSGPKPLREAAVEALKHYQYAPATQSGKAVASKVTTTVKFWFNP